MPLTTYPHQYCPHQPTPFQKKVLGCSAFEMLCGGAVGGGKSDVLLMAGLQYADTPGYSALLLRRTFQALSLPGGLIFRAHEWLGPSDASWDGTGKRWRFPSGATLQFGYLETDADLARYMSSEFQFIGFDEATQFLPHQYLYMFSRVRRAGDLDVPIRVWCGSNPGSVGHSFFKRRFGTDKIGTNPEGRVYIPARIRDNPYLKADEYEKTLGNLPETFRRQLMDGDWSATEGGAVYQRHAITADKATRTVDKRTSAVRAWARGLDKNQYSCGVLVERYGGEYVVADVQFGKWTAAELYGRVMADHIPKGCSIVADAAQGTADALRRIGVKVRVPRANVQDDERAAMAAAVSGRGAVRYNDSPAMDEFLDALEAWPLVEDQLAIGHAFALAITEATGLGDAVEGGERKECSCNGRLVHASWCPMDKQPAGGDGHWMPNVREHGFGGIELDKP